MTDRELLEALYQDMQAVKEKVTDLETNISTLKRQVMKSTAELKAMDEIILDEVERVHEILERHKADKKAHTA